MIIEMLLGPTEVEVTLAIDNSQKLHDCTPR